MASYGHVLDLLDDRYLNLQDVIGNLDPLPTLVPYKAYNQNVLVYRMDGPHEVFMGLMQDFTARAAIETNKELWTWCVQWDVQCRPTYRFNTYAPSPKRPRLDVGEVEGQPAAAQPQRRAPVIDNVHRCILSRQLMREEDMLRVLIDIVQVDSPLVPNFIEFLYRWVDFYEGDGKALKAALQWEIPSLWDFEYHPLTLPEEERKRMETERFHQAEPREAVKTGIQQGAGTSHATDSNTEDLMQASPTKKMRQKPDLTALESRVQESERLQYREVKYGMQPPSLQQPLPPLINIPRNHYKRIKYYAACFKSRQRALVLLLESGMTMLQISNYKRLQVAHPMDTSKVGDLRELKGLKHYHKDAQAAQEHFDYREQQQLLREKHKEISISHKLAEEALLAASNGALEGPSGIPLIPPTPSYEKVGGQSSMAAMMMERIRKATANGEEKINIVPAPLVGKMKSKLFEGAVDQYRWNVERIIRNGTGLPPGFGRTPLGEIRSPADSEVATAGEPSPLTPRSGNLSLPSTVPRPDLPHLSLPTQQQPMTAPIIAPPITLADTNATNPQQSQTQSSTIPALDGIPSGPLDASSITYIHSLSSNHLQQLVCLFRYLGASAPIVDFANARLRMLQGTSPLPTSLASGPIYLPPHADQLFNFDIPRPPLAPIPPAFGPPRPGIQRNAPAPLTLAPPAQSPFSSLGPSLLATSPFMPPPNTVPIQIYLPQVIVPGNAIGPGGARMGDGGAIETDAFLMGTTVPGTGTIEITKAIFLPMGVWKNVLRRVQMGNWSVLETYAAGAFKIPGVNTPHSAVYSKLAQAYDIMRSSDNREEDVTKRWRTTPGKVTMVDRGSVWEGWGVSLDRPVEMSAEERKGAWMSSALIDDGVDRRVVGDDELQRRRREMDELLEEDEYGDMEVDLGEETDEDEGMISYVDSDSDVAMEG